MGSCWLGRTDNGKRRHLVEKKREMVTATTFYFLTYLKDQDVMKEEEG